MPDWSAVITRRASRGRRLRERQGLEAA